MHEGLLRSVALARRKAPARRGRDRSSFGLRMRPARSRAVTRPRNRSAAARSASSGSTCILRAVLTAANSTSPSSSKRCSRVAAASSSSVSSRIACSAASISGKSNPVAAARRWTLRAYSGPGRFSGTSPKIPGSRPASPCLIWSQLRRTSCAVSASAVAEHVRVAADQLGGAVLGHLRQVARTRAPPAAARGTRPGTGHRPVRPAAWRRLHAGRRRPARRPPPRCGGRSSARPARGPTDIPCAAGG